MSEEQAREGIPQDLMPMWPSWDLPGGPLAEFPDRSKLEGYDGRGAWLGLGGEATRITAKFLPRLTNLEFLAIVGQSTPQAILDGVAQLTGLRRLHLTNVRSDDLGFLKDLEKLEYLCILGLPNARDISPVLDCRNLVSLGLGSGIDDLQAFQDDPLPHLEALFLEGTSESKPAIFPTLAPLVGIKRLKYLSLLNCKVTDKSLSVLLESPSLRVIEVASRRPWPDAEVEAIERSRIELVVLGE